MNAENRFISAFLKCLEDGVHPGPAEINDRLGRGRKNHLNGRESRLRVRLMRIHKVPYKLNGAYGRAGEVPGIQALSFGSQMDLNFRDDG